MNQENSNETSKLDPKELELSQCILVDIDFLFDTRMGTISRISEDAIPNVFKRGYWKRNHDFFDRFDERVDMRKFDILYQKRDWLTFANSRYCNSLLWLNALTRKLERRMIDTPYKFPVTVYLNIYPFEFTEVECNIIANDLKENLAITTTVNVIRKSNQELSPQWVKEHVSLLAKYDGDDWLRVNSDLLLKNPMPTISIVMPTIIKDRTTLTPMAKGMDGKEYNLFEQLAMGLAVLIDMIYVPLEDVSVINPVITKKIMDYQQERLKAEEQSS